MSVVKEFREFAVKGNVVDMAVGLIIGAAFGRIVNSLVTDLLMPPLGFVIGGVDFSALKIALPAVADPKLPPIVIRYGLFLNNVIYFLIVAVAVFLLVKGVNALRRNQKAPPAAAPVPTAEEKLLAEIRDLLKNGK